MHIRPLESDDAAAYQELRLVSLRDHPEAFTTDFIEEASLGLDAFAARLAASETSISFGAWDENNLVGIASLNRPARLRLRFRATIAGMYVAPSHRRRGVARDLLAACIEHARRQRGLEEVCLCVTAGNEPARRAYEAFGFCTEFVEPRYFKYQGRYYDLEWMRFALDPVEIPDTSPATFSAGRSSS